MLCGNCKKNQATKTYEQIKKGKKVVEYYCLDCYHQLFIDTESQTGKEEASACPYCGTTAEEVKKRKLVGCARCYETLSNVLYPIVSKMQGGAAHTGKKPFGGELERIARRCYELKAIAEKLRKEKDFEGEKACLKRLHALQTGYAEEDFVWRKRLDLYKRS